MTQIRAYRFLASLAREFKVTPQTALNWKKSGKLTPITVVSDFKIQEGKKHRRPTEFTAWVKPITITTVQGKSVTEE